MAGNPFAVIGEAELRTGRESDRNDERNGDGNRVDELCLDF